MLHKVRRIITANDENNDGQITKSDFRLQKDVYLPNCDGVLGIGVGAGNNLWAACYYQHSTAVFSADPNVQTINYHPIGTNPYTYSDFTGNLRSTFTAPRGNYSEIFEGCPGVAGGDVRPGLGVLALGKPIEVLVDGVAQGRHVLAGETGQALSDQVPEGVAVGVGNDGEK